MVLFVVPKEVYCSQQGNSLAGGGTWHYTGLDIVGLGHGLFYRILGGYVALPVLGATTGSTTGLL